MSDIRQAIELRIMRFPDRFISPLRLVAVYNGYTDQPDFRVIQTLEHKNRA